MCPRPRTQSHRNLPRTQTANPSQRNRCAKESAPWPATRLSGKASRTENWRNAPTADRRSSQSRCPGVVRRLSRFLRWCWGRQSSSPMKAAIAQRLIGSVPTPMLLPPLRTVLPASASSRFTLRSTPNRRISVTDAKIQPILPPSYVCVDVLLSSSPLSSTEY